MNLKAIFRIFIMLPLHYLGCVLVSCFAHPLTHQRIELEIRNPDWKYKIDIVDVEENNT